MIRKITIDEVEEGMYVSGFEKDGSQDVTFTNNILVKGAKDVEQFRAQGFNFAYVFFPGPDPEPAGEAQAAQIRPCPVDGAADAPELAVREADLEEAVLVDEYEDEITDLVEFKEEIKEAVRIRDEAEEIVREFSQDFRMGCGINSKKVHKTVEKMIGSIFRNRDALTSLVRIKSFDRYVFTHSVNVSILSLIIGRNMGLGRERLGDIGMGAILHDVGKMLIPEHILHKPDALTAEELAEVRKHPELGAEVISMSKDISGDSIKIISQHHENYSGKGYPSGIKGEEIHLYARIVSVADIYDAMTSDRVYRKAVTPNEVLQKMYMLRFSHYDPEFVERLIKALGIYPVGTLVALNTGELAIVRRQDATHPLKPTLLILFDKDRQPYKEPFELDLIEDDLRFIVASKDPAALGMAFNDFLLEA